MKIVKCRPGQDVSKPYGASESGKRCTTLYIPVRLDFFKDDSAGEKTEKPTQRRRAKSREEGSVARSQEVGTAVLLIFGFLALKFFGGYMYEKISDFTAEMFMLVGDVNDIFTTDFIAALINKTILMFCVTLLPLYAIIIATSFIASLVQVGWHPTTKPLAFKIQKLKPDFKKIFSVRNLVEFLKSLLIIALIGTVIYNMVKDEIEHIMMLISFDLVAAMLYVCELSVDVGLRVGLYFILVAALDYIYQRRSHEKKLKMSKQEIKDEYKMIEGDPHIKAKIKGKMREISMRRMMQNIPAADVVITNPTHYAVAIQYDRESSSAPIVVAKGVDHLAKRIWEAAKENNVEVVENVQLARTLYATVDVGREIPPELYQAVAEILAFVYKLKNAI